MQPDETPAALGYRWPAEWEDHAATWLAWPHNRNTWPGHFEPIPGRFAAFVRTLARFEPVNILAGGQDVMIAARELVGDVPNVRLWDVPTNDAWCRDHGPTFLAGRPGLPAALVDWEYNAWGGKYPPFDQDNCVPRRIAERLGRRRFQPGIVLEGGAIEGNGAGTLLTTASCLLNPNRNPHLDRDALEQYLRDYLGVSHILWLSRGELTGDDTDGHIDQLARFVNATTVVATAERNRGDANYEPLRDNLKQLTSLCDQDGRRLEVVPLYLPQPKYVEGQRVPASYANFYIANGAVVVPTYDDPADEAALARCKTCFPPEKSSASPHSTSPGASAPFTACRSRNRSSQ